jgi:hypothetical protein
MTEEIFTGYIDLDGNHIEDGLKNPPKTVICQDEQSITLCWITIDNTGLNAPAHLTKKTYTKDIQPEIMEVSPNAWSAYRRWLDIEQPGASCTE